MVAWLVVGMVLLVAAAMKAADRTETTVALAGYGVPGRLAAPAWGTLVAVEAALAAALWAGAEAVAYLSGLLFAGFLLLQLVALEQGGAGAPCGCFGARGRLSRASAARTALLAVACAALPLAGAGPDLPLFVTGAVAAAVVVLAAGRRAPAPDGALDVAGEGPPLGGHSCLDAVVPAGELRLAVFTSPDCGLCRRVTPATDAIAAEGVAVGRLDEERDADAWAAARIPGAPYAVALDRFGLVLAKGTVNDAAQLRSVLATAQARRAAAAAVQRPGRAGTMPEPVEGAARSHGGTSRRAFLGRAGGIAAGAAGAGLVGSLVRPGEAEAYHFCGHIYTTDGCPHPTGLPRIDRRGLPLRALDGRAVDDLGRLVDVAGLPVDELGIRLADLEGRPLPSAPRTAICAATGRDFAIRVKTDGAWYRCCGGRVRKLVDCCSPNDQRINGDRALKGYCYADRKVFCVMYYQSSVPC